MTNIYNNLSEKELKYSYWYITHRVFLRKLGILVLAAVSVGLLIYGITLITTYYLKSTSDTEKIAEKMAQEKLNLQLLAEANKPKDLVVSETRVLRGNKGSVDFMTEIINPNTQWAVDSLQYYYTEGGAKTDMETDYVLPGQTKYLLHFNYPSTSTSLAVRLVLEKVNWKKVVDFDTMQKSMIDFEVKNAKVSSVAKVTEATPESVTNISFDIFNKSAYSFWEPRFVILLERGGDLVAVAETNLAALGSNEKRTESINLFQNIPASTQITIIPDINILDPGVFKGFDVGSGEKK